MTLELRQRLLTISDSEGNGSRDFFNVWYLDEGYIIAKHEQLSSALDYLMSNEVENYGLHLNLAKCEVWWPEKPPNDLQTAYPDALSQKYTDRTRILNAPLRSNGFMKQMFFEKVQSLKHLFEKVAALENSQVAFNLLKFCLGVCKVHYVLRVTPVECCMDGAKLYDTLVEETLRTMVGGTLDTLVFKELPLPTKPTSAGVPTLGLGLTSAVTIALSAFLASSASCNALVGSILGTSCPTSLMEYESATSAYYAWSNQCEEISALPFSSFDAERPPKQHTITALVHKKISSDLPEGSNGMKIMRISMKLPEATTWIQCRPSETLKRSIPHHHVRVWLQYFCQVPLFQPGSRYARHQCAAVMDFYGDHLLHCERGTHRIARHDEQVRILVGDLSKAALHPVLERRPLGRNRERPNIRAISSHGGSDLFDITFCHPLTPARIRDSVQNPLSILKAAWSAKSARQASVLETYVTTVHLSPVPISTLGGWHPDSYREMGSVVSSIASRALSCLSAARSILFQRHAALLVKNNAECLMSGLISGM